MRPPIQRPPSTRRSGARPAPLASPAAASRPAAISPAGPPGASRPALPGQGAPDLLEDARPGRRRHLAGGVEGPRELGDRPGMVVDLEGHLLAVADEAVAAAVEADDVGLEPVAQAWLRDTAP